MLKVLKNLHVVPPSDVTVEGLRFGKGDCFEIVAASAGFEPCTAHLEA